MWYQPFYFIILAKAGETKKVNQLRNNWFKSAKAIILVSSHLRGFLCFKSIKRNASI